MLTRVPAVTLCLSVSLTFCGKVPAWRLFSTSPTLCFEEIQVGPIYKNNGTSLWNFFLNLGFRKFRQDKSIVEMCYTQLDKSGRSERDKLDCRWSTKLTVPPSSDGRLLVYHSDRQTLFTARFRRAGLSTIADTCLDMPAHRQTCWLQCLHPARGKEKIVLDQ